MTFESEQSGLWTRTADDGGTARAFALARFAFLDPSGNVERVIRSTTRIASFWCRDFTATCRDADPVGDVSKAT